MIIGSFRDDLNEWKSCSVTIEKCGKTVKTIQYNDTNGHIIKDMIKLLKKKYPIKDGYRVKTL